MYNTYIIANIINYLSFLTLSVADIYRNDNLFSYVLKIRKTNNIYENLYNVIKSIINKYCDFS